MKFSPDIFSFHGSMAKRKIVALFFIYGSCKELFICTLPCRTQPSALNYIRVLLDTNVLICLGMLFIGDSVPIDTLLDDLSCNGKV